ncbi:liprin-beta-1 isoform X3 [Octopus bimaculoides]|uniref:liprin-beta-1 isoform X3 n=1 Tax=Octopus bimaculoides TaxID=37653 RepID=UPI0022E95F69|nr:liprin-beta-1 isoform X3 [Octopus bimaculoides]
MEASLDSPGGETLGLIGGSTARPSTNGGGTINANNNGTSSRDGSDMLAAALEQMDNIIALYSQPPPEKQKFSGTKREYRNSNLATRPTVKGRLQNARAIFLLEDLKGTLEQCENKQQILEHASSSALKFLREWLEDESLGGANIGETFEEKITRLESDKQNLLLQIGVLKDQLEAKGDKIRELEFSLEDKRSRLFTTEQMLQNELLTRASLETDKQDLMAEVTSLKIKLTTAERERHELEEQLKSAHKRITELEKKLLLRDAELHELKQRLTKNGTILSTDSAGDVSNNRPLERERTLDRLKKKQSEIEKLKKAVDSLMLANEEKNGGISWDRRLEDYGKLLRRYKKIEEMLIQAQGRRALDDLMANFEDDNSSTTSSMSPSTGSGGKDTADGTKSDDSKDKHLSGPSATSTPGSTTVKQRSNSQDKAQVSPISPALGDAELDQRSGTFVRSNSCEEISNSTEKTPPITKKKDNPYGYGTLPKDRHKDEEKGKLRVFPTLGKTLLRMKTGKRSCSAPNLAQSEIATDDEDVIGRHGNVHNRLHHTDSGRWKGFKRFIGRLKRSSSQDFDGDMNEEFRRGGIRATAGARLAWSKDLKINHDSNVPFESWDNDRVASWLHEIGLDMYVPEARRWIKNGEQLLNATQHDFEKELGMKNHLHRKKLQLALEAAHSGLKDRILELNHNWVTRWLDDIGIPQYKDTFFEARVDGLMLHYMTVEDLLALKVSNELHHISIKRAIQTLRMHNFNPQCLKRRPSADEVNKQNIPSEVILWSNHRVMEWLRTIDLSEYAPNLRGSGVHGALIVLEPRFNAELFSQVLSIPGNKSLLRRHLSTHFVALIGNEMQHKKREFETSADYQPLFPNSKVKRRNNFLLFGHKRSKSESQTESFICPIKNTSSVNGTDHMFNKLMSCQHNNGSIKERDEIAAKEIGAVSKEISSLTVMLSQEKFLENVPTSNV